MSPSPSHSQTSPVIYEQRVNQEKLAELLNLGTEYYDLGFKRKLDLYGAPGPFSGRTGNLAEKDRH